LRILFIDIDTLRPDHLGCYGYHRDTSPNIDRIAAQGTRFENCYAPDVPCLPSRSALWSGLFGIHTGVINHGGTAADPFIEGPGRGFRDAYDRTGWIPTLKRLGLRPVTVSPFGERHSAWWWYAGWSEVYNPGQGGLESAHHVTPLALDWLERHGQEKDWFLHVNYWDPHTPYRTPAEFGNPFEQDPLPAWLTEEVRQRCWEGFGPHSAREPHGYGVDAWDEEVRHRYPHLPATLDSLKAVKAWIDGYDTGIRYADQHAGLLLAALEKLGIAQDTAIIISSDHGENQGELNVWGDHQTADHITCRVPLLIRWPGLPPRVDKALHYNFDWAAALIAALGGKVPANWDGQPFALSPSSADNQTHTHLSPSPFPLNGTGRPYLVLSQGAWACQRSVRFLHDGRDYLCMRTYHDGHKQLEPVMLFDLTQDPHEQHDLAGERPDLVAHAMSLLADWQAEMMITARTDVDPMMTVLREGGPFHTRGNLPRYLERLRLTGREIHADRLEKIHPDEASTRKLDSEN
jgi:choline-sulfatase